MSGRNRWVTFDCFGTLVDWKAWFATTLAPLAGDGAAALQRAYLAYERIVEAEQPFRSFKDVVVTASLRAAGELGVPLGLSDRRAVPNAWASMRLFEDVEAMLAELRLKGWRLGVLTNCDDDLFEITHRTFREPFDLFVTSERVRGYKPARWHFRAFELLTGVERQNWVHVASSWDHDIAPAQEFGLNHVWLDRDGAGKGSGTSSVRVCSGAEIASTIEALVERELVAEPMLCTGGL